MPDITLADGINMALAHELTRDPNVVLFGEDIGKNGGVFRVTAGLQEKFGENRVWDSPLAESMIVGLAIGLSTQKFRPIVEIQFEGFLFPAFDQLISHASRIRNRTRGRLSCPMVVRVPWGGGIHAPEHHSDSPEALLAHIPGLRVVIPSSPERAYGLLLASIRDPDPVIFFEPKRIYRKVKQNVEDTGEALPLDTCFILREGEDITLVTWGAMIFETLEAAKILEKEGINAEVIDVATIKPLDMKTILNSVEKTGRCVIIHEAPKTCGVGAEIAASLAEHALTSLLAPIERVTGYDTIMPLLKLENHYIPSTERIVRGAKKVMEFS